jgi:excisionase family DNA binding protein
MSSISKKPDLPARRQWFTYDTASDYLGLTVRQTQRAVAARKLGYTRLGLRTLFDQAQLDAYIESCTVKPEL